MYLDILPWAIFLAFVAGMLALDLGVFHRNAHEVSRREALAWSAVWIGLAIIFNTGVYVFQGSDRGLEWTTGYLIEKSLSVDNVFVFLLIFSMFAVPAKYQHRVLFWGIVGALFMRAILILVGAALLDAAHFVIYIFGGFLILTGVKFLRDKGDHVPSLDRNLLVRLARRVRPVTEAYEGQKFFVRRAGALNIFAILGLRALYFVLSGYLAGLAYLKPALAAVLVFVGAKMVLADVYKIDPLVSLLVIALILVGAIIASLLVQREGGGVPLQGAGLAEPAE
jgi:tellurite resistance protein TerC